MNSGRFRIGDLVIDPGARMVYRGDLGIELPRLSFDTLLSLAEASPDVLSIEELMERVWRGVVVSPATVAKRIELLRQALGDDSAEPRYVALVRGYGYRLVPDVRAEHPEREPAQVTSSPSKRSRSLRGWILTLVVLAMIAAGAVFWPESEPPERTIAVLPFTALSDAPEDQWFADGLTEELAHSLARSGAMRVTGRSSAFRFRDTDVPAQTIGEALDVAHLLEGSVRRAEGRIRVVTQLTSTKDGFQLWSETFEMPDEGILTIQRNIARRVLERFQVSEEALPTDFSRPELVNPAAYSLYLEAVSLTHYRSAQDLPRAQALIEQVLEMDPDFADAWARLALIHGRRLLVDPSYEMSPGESLQLAIDANQRAMSIDPELPEVYANLAGAAWVFEHDEAAAAGNLEEAIRKAPWNLDLLTFASDFSRAVGQLPLSLRIAREVVRRDPLCENCRQRLAETLLCLGDLDGAESHFNLLGDADAAALKWRQGMLSLLRGKPRDALEAFSQSPAADRRLAGTAMSRYSLEQVEAARADLHELLDLEPRAAWQRRAMALAWLGESGQALDVLEAVAVQNRLAVQLIACHPAFDPLRDQPRWRELMKRLNQAPDQIRPLVITGFETPLAAD